MRRARWLLPLLLAAAASTATAEHEIFYRYTVLGYVTALPRVASLASALPFTLRRQSNKGRRAGVSADRAGRHGVIP